MDVAALLKAAAQQRSPQTVGDGQQAGLRMSRAGQLFVADWKTELVLAGMAYNVSVGDISAGADVSLITGGGNGTTIDSDQPELAVGTPSGYYHIPLGFEFAGQVDVDADQEEGNVLLFADTAKIIPLPIAASSTVETPANLLGGGPAAVSYAQSAVTTDITDPVLSMLLAWATTQCSEVTAAGYAMPDLKLSWQPLFPIILKGPCSVVACWGGTAAVVGMASYYFAEVPAARVE